MIHIYHGRDFISLDDTILMKYSELPRYLSSYRTKYQKRSINIQSLIDRIDKNPVFTAIFDPELGYLNINLYGKLHNRSLIFRIENESDIQHFNLQIIVSQNNLEILEIVDSISNKIINSYNYTNASYSNLDNYTYLPFIEAAYKNNIEMFEYLIERLISEKEIYREKEIGGEGENTTSTSTLDSNTFDNET